MEKPNTTRRGWKCRVQGNQNLLCGLVMRSNCCCDSHSTTRPVSCKKVSIYFAQTQTWSPLLLLLLLWDVVGFRGQRQEVEVKVIFLESMQICCPHENGTAAFSDFSTLRPVFKKVHFQDPRGRSAKMMQKMCATKSVEASDRETTGWVPMR